MTTAERRENAVQIVILVVVGLMAGAASFTHVHDWTMDNSPAGTGDWFGWTNALVSELTPTAAGIEVRRRRRNGYKIGYPLAVLVAAVALSIAAQFAQATPSVSGWLLAAVPALGFLALTKLVLGRPTTTPTPAAVATANPEDDVFDVIPASAPEVDLPADLVMGARLAAFSHQQTTGSPMTGAALAERFNLHPTTAAQLLAAITDTALPPAVMAVNGTHYPNGGRS
jgi:hypothetical protein